MLTQSLGTHPTPSNSTHRGSRTLDMQFVFVAVGILRSVGIHPDGDQPASSCSARAAQLRNHGLNFHANEYTLLTRGVNETALLEPGGLWYRDDKYTADILRGSSMNPEERQKMWLGMKRGQNGSASESMIEDSGTREHGSDADAETGDEGAGIDGDDEKKRHLRMLRSRLLYAHNKSGAKSVARSDSGTNVNIGGRHTASAGSAITSSSRASGAICAEQAGVGAEGCVQLCRETASVLILR